MALTATDLHDIRTIVTEVICEAFIEIANPRFDRIEAQLDRLETRVSNLESQQRELTHRVTIVERSVLDISGRLKAVENDIKELYHMVGKAIKPFFQDAAYQELSTKKKLIFLNSAVTSLAQEMGIRLA